MQVDVTTFHLEMTDRSQFCPVPLDRPGVELKKSEVVCPELNHFFYTAVGGDWFWVDRLDWTYDRWLAWLDRPEVETWVLYVSGTTAGYFELESQPGGNVEIAYFGLLPRFVGQGLGMGMLSGAIERAWAMGASRVWLHTCTRDHPRGLDNYQAQGFRIFKEAQSVEHLPDEAPGPWPGAQKKAQRHKVREEGTDVM